MDLTNRITAILESEPDAQVRVTDPMAHAAANGTGPGSNGAHPRLTPSPPHPLTHPRIDAILSTPSLLDPLLDDYLEGHLPLHRLAHNHNLSVTDLIAILDSPRIVALLDNLTRHAELQAQRLAILARPRAIEKLTHLVESDLSYHKLLAPAVEARSRETTRKAAAHIERISKPAPARSKPGAAERSRTPHAPQATESPISPPALAAAHAQACAPFRPRSPTPPDAAVGTTARADHTPQRSLSLAHGGAT